MTKNRRTPKRCCPLYLTGRSRPAPTSNNGRKHLMPAPRVTRAHTVADHLIKGGFTKLRLTEREQATGPSAAQQEGFCVRNFRTPAGILVTVVGVYGPDWVMTSAAVKHRLNIRYTTTGEAPGLEVHESMVRWATATELRARRRHEQARVAPVAALIRRQEARARAEAAQQALADAGQGGLF
ncbi:hypothetical protein ACFY0Z_30050 [Streptomyces kronopolitis]|uniref:hypothetical protein n=1 Tax=Streptomyces kronopolitis TaxID=1612435 RepID=UPI0036BAE309